MIARVEGPFASGPGARRWLAALGGDGIGPRFAARASTTDLDARWIGVVR